MNKIIKLVDYNEYLDSESSFKHALKTAIKLHKIVHLKNVPINLELGGFYSKLINEIGKVISRNEDIGTGNFIDSPWMDIKYDKNKENTFRHSNTRQPLHTDAAYTNYDMDVNFFYCIQDAQIGGATVFFDSEDLVSILKKYEPELLKGLENVLVLFDKGHDQRKESKIIDYDRRGIKLNWNYFRVSSENSKKIKDLCNRFHNFLEEKIYSGGLTISVYLKPGECVFFYDNRLLHGRNSFYGDRFLMKGSFNFS